MKLKNILFPILASIGVISVFSIPKEVNASAELIVQEAEKLLAARGEGSSNPMPYSQAGGRLNFTTHGDCSAFTRKVLLNAGYSDIGTYTKQQLENNQGQFVGNISDLQPGDLMFFRDPDGSSGHTATLPDGRKVNVSHVAIYIGNNTMIHMSAGVGTINKRDISNNNYYQSNFVGGRRFHSGSMASLGPEYLTTSNSMEEPFNLTVADLNKRLNYNSSDSKTNALANKGAVFQSAGEEFGIDPAFLVALAVHETTYGVSHNVQMRNNTGGITCPAETAWNGLKTWEEFNILRCEKNDAGANYAVYESVNDSIRHKAFILYSYAEGHHPDGDYKADTVKEVGNIYAPVGADNDPNNQNVHWVPTIVSIMKAMGVNANFGVDGNGGSPNQNGDSLNLEDVYKLGTMYESELHLRALMQTDFTAANNLEYDKYYKNLATFRLKQPYDHREKETIFKEELANLNEKPRKDLEFALWEMGYLKYEDKPIDDDNHQPGYNDLMDWDDFEKKVVPLFDPEKNARYDEFIYKIRSNNLFAGMVIEKYYEIDLSKEERKQKIKAALTNGLTEEAVLQDFKNLKYDDGISINVLSSLAIGDYFASRGADTFRDTNWAWVGFKTKKFSKRFNDYVLAQREKMEQGVDGDYGDRNEGGGPWYKRLWEATGDVFRSINELRKDFSPINWLKSGFLRLEAGYFDMAAGDNEFLRYAGFHEPDDLVEVGRNAFYQCYFYRSYFQKGFMEAINGDNSKYIYEDAFESNNFTGSIEEVNQTFCQVVRDNMVEPMLWEDTAVLHNRKIVQTLTFNCGGRSNFTHGEGAPSYDSGGGTPPGELPGNDNAEKVWNFFASKGFGAEAIAGIMGNLQQESQFDTRAIGPPTKYGRAEGLGQWLGGRLTGLRSWAQNEGLDFYAIETQTEWLWKELNGGDSTTKSKLDKKYGGLEALKTMSISDAVVAFEDSFERSGGSAMSKRLQYANKIYAKYGSTPPAPAETSATKVVKINSSTNNSKVTLMNYDVNNEEFNYKYEKGPYGEEIILDQRNTFNNRHAIEMGTDLYSGEPEKWKDFYYSLKDGTVNSKGILIANPPNNDLFMIEGNQAMGISKSMSETVEFTWISEYDNVEMYFSIEKPPSCNEEGEDLGYTLDETIFLKHETTVDIIENAKKYSLYEPGVTVDEKAESWEKEVNTQIAEMTNLDSVLNKSQLENLIQGISNNPNVLPTNPGDGNGNGDGPPNITDGTFNVPVTGTISSGWGMRWGRPHRGIDIAGGNNGAQIIAAADGTVNRAYKSDSYGNTVILEHNMNGEKYFTLYAHMQDGSMAVSTGQTVTKGQNIGKVGNTGDSQGPHLHFEIHRGTLGYSGFANTINPIKYIDWGDAGYKCQATASNCPGK